MARQMVAEVRDGAFVRRVETSAYVIERRWEGPAHWRTKSLKDLRAVRDELTGRCPGEFQGLVDELSTEITRRELEIAVA